MTPSRRFAGVVFDLFGTLTNWEREAQRQAQCDRLADVLGAGRTEFRAALRASFTERSTGRLGDTAATIRALAEQLGCGTDEQVLAHAVACRLDQERYIVEPTDVAVHVLGELRRRGLPVGVLSDCGSEIAEMWATLPYDEFVTAAVFSYDVGERKPSRSMYDAVAVALGVPPAELLYVGDGSSQELSGARAAGMWAVQLDVCPDPEMQYDREVDWDGPKVGSLLQVLPLLDPPGDDSSRSKS